MTAGPDALRFAYHRSLAPTLWALAALSVVELFALHLLVALIWSRTAAAVLSLLTLSGITWLVALIRSFKHRPVLIGGGRLVWPAGRLREVALPLADVAGLRATWDRAAVKRPDVFNAAIAAYPNVFIDLVRPAAMGRREVIALTHRLDDPEAFTAALSRARAHA